MVNFNQWSLVKSYNFNSYILTLWTGRGGELILCDYFWPKVEVYTHFYRIILNQSSYTTRIQYYSIGLSANIQIRLKDSTFCIVSVHWHLCLLPTHNVILHHPKSVYSENAFKQTELCEWLTLKIIAFGIITSYHYTCSTLLLTYFHEFFQ